MGNLEELSLVAMALHFAVSFHEGVERALACFEQLFMDASPCCEAEAGRLGYNREAQATRTETGHGGLDDGDLEQGFTGWRFWIVRESPEVV